MDMENICRLCCQKKGRLRPLFEHRKEYPLSLRQIISDLSRLEVDPGDRMPQQVCRWCVTTLLKMHETVEMYRENDLKLRAQLGSASMLVEIKQEEEEVDMALLEKALDIDLEVGDILPKEEYMKEEFRELKQREDSEVTTGQMEETVVKDKDPSDTETEEETGRDKDDDEWVPTEEVAKDEEPPVKKIRRRRRAKNDGDGQPKRGRRGQKDPNRPRLHDYKCYICKSEPLESPEALIAHLNGTHLDLVPYTCSECVMDTVVIRSVQRLNGHKRQHLNPEKCPFCDKRYTDKGNVQFHVETFHQNRCPSTCEHCGKVCPTKASLLHHIKLHTTAASCEICGKVFKERVKLRLHIQRRHEKLKKHECNICHKKLGSLDSVRTHIKTFHANQVFKCSYCPRTFAAEPTHRAHEKKHIDNPDYVASKDWSEYYTIVEGEEEKPGVNMKRCNLCGFLSTTMGIHLSLVHFPTEYRCDICGATFKRKQTRDTHVAKHGNSLAMQCPICNRECSDRKNLIAHLRTKKHQDHPLAQSLEWLGFNAAKSMRSKTKPKEANGGGQQQAEIGEEIEMDDSL